MKTFWKKMFWWDAPAKGAFFALTLLLVGAYVLGSLSLFVWEMGWIYQSWYAQLEQDIRLALFLIPFVALLLYYMFQTLFSFYRVGNGWVRNVGPSGFSLWIGFGFILLLFSHTVSGWFIPLWLMVFFTVILPLSACCGKHWRWAVLCILFWSLGASLVWDAGAAFDVNLNLFRPITRLCGREPGPVVIPLAQQWGVSGYGWTAWFALVCLLFAGWYLLTAKLFAQMGNCRFRAMFGRPVLALWAVKILVYLTFFGMVIYQKEHVSHSLAELEQRFDRPITAKALGELYFGGEQPGTEFWRRAEDLKEEDWKSERDSNFLTYRNLLSSPNAKLSNADLERFRNELNRPDSTSNRWEQLFSGSIPPVPCEFREGTLYAMIQPNLTAIRHLDLLKLWRIRLALADGRIDDAVAAYRCMERVNRSLYRETSLTGGLVWRAAENFRLDGVELLLESGRLSNDQLQNISAGLIPVESEIPRMLERSLYGEAVSSIDMCDSIVTGMLFDDQELKPVPLRVLRYYFPQFWWLFLREKAMVARNLKIPDFSRPPANSSDQSILAAILLTDPKWVTKRFEELAARLRGMRALIAAELWKREHGDYPETLPALPEDPRTGTPLLYRKGESRIQVERFHYNPETENWDSRMEERTVPAVQVWSPAAGNDGPQNRTRAIRKL